MAANDMMVTITVSSAARSPSTRQRGIGSASCISSTPDESSADQRDTTVIAKMATSACAKLSQINASSTVCTSPGRPRRYGAQARGRCEEGRGDVDEEHDRRSRRPPSRRSSRARRRDGSTVRAQPGCAAADSTTARGRRVHAAERVRMSPAPMSRRTNADRRDHSRDRGDDEEPEGRRKVEGAARGNGVGLVEQVEDGDVGDRRSLHARPPDAVERET